MLIKVGGEDERTGGHRVDVHCPKPAACLIGIAEAGPLAVIRRAMDVVVVVCVFRAAAIAFAAVLDTKSSG